MTLVYVLDILGTFTFAVSGAIIAARKQFDIFGALVIAFVTAVGGGTLRDMILGRSSLAGYEPIFWMQDITYFWAILAAVVVTLLFFRFMDRFRHVLLTFDAVGIGVFTIIGIGKAEALGIQPVFCVMMGVMTAVMGGMLRDVICQTSPIVLRKEIYATACIAGGVVYYLLEGVLVHDLRVLVTIGFIIVVRLFSVYRGLALPLMSRKLDEHSK
ncbi:MAG TPA: trimeric intracellular cation channel family protein [Spirochaetota bacterium]|nr:trimeric intracellular cation channel family protein [Spirochaetota bacterium]HPN81814.1 trimeric intracellular cation channel family protein [Spirochaetota bacterium]